jgi:hypothetical protein
MMAAGMIAVGLRHFRSLTAARLRVADERGADSATTPIQRVLHALLVFEVFVARRQDIESGRLSRFQEFAVLQPGETRTLDGHGIELGEPAPQFVREILVKQAEYLQTGCDLC